MLHSFNKPTALSDCLEVLSEVIVAIQEHPEGTDIRLSLPEQESKELEAFFALHRIPCINVYEDVWSVAECVSALDERERQR